MTRYGHRWTDEEVNEAARLHRDGLTYAEVAAELGRTRKGVAVALQGRGIAGRRGRPRGGR